MGSGRSRVEGIIPHRSKLRSIEESEVQGNNVLTIISDSRIVVLIFRANLLESGTARECILCSLICLNSATLVHAQGWFATSKMMTGLLDYKDPILGDLLSYL